MSTDVNLTGEDLNPFSRRLRGEIDYYIGQNVEGIQISLSAMTEKLEDHTRDISRAKQMAEKVHRQCVSA
jgi:hypothetical protein